MSLSGLGSRCHPLRFHLNLKSMKNAFMSLRCGHAEFLRTERPTSFIIWCFADSFVWPLRLSRLVFIYGLARTLLCSGHTSWLLWRACMEVQGHSTECTLMPTALAYCHGASMRNVPGMNCRIEEVKDQRNHKEPMTALRSIRLKDKSVFFLG